MAGGWRDGGPAATRRSARCTFVVVTTGFLAPLALASGPLDVRSVAIGRYVRRAVREKLGATQGYRAMAARHSGLGVVGMHPTCSIDQGHAVRQFYGVLPHVHAQHRTPGSTQRGAAPGRGRALAQAESTGGEALTRGNTRRIRIRAMHDALHEERAAPYSVCFREGDWVRVGWPDPYAAPPDDNRETCVRLSVSDGGLSADCWLRCARADVLTPSMRDYMINATEHVLVEMATYLRVPLSDGPLVLRRSDGTYTGFYEAVGVPGEACAADCAKLHALPVADELCSRGADDADVLLYVRRPPPVAGVSGTGSACAIDERGRPIVIAFDWHALPDDTATVGWHEAPPEQRAAARAIVLHELLHGLGFSIEHWTGALHANGTRKQLVGALPLTKATIGVGLGGEADGVEPGGSETVWHFLPGTRTFETAARYFGCAGAGAGEWRGLPLMSYPDFGRASHVETRIMREDVMSYGDGQALVSAITLATFEDLGMYVAEYARAQCLSWGRNQGCAFVSRRCEARAHRREVRLLANESAASLCSREWPQLRSEVADTSMCAPTRCATLAHSAPPVPPPSPSSPPPVMLDAAPMPDEGERCDAECYTGPLSRDESCASHAPSGNVQAAGVRTERPQISAGARAWLVLLLMLLGPTVGLLCTAFGPVRRLLSRSLDRVCGARLPPTARARGVVTALCGFGCAGGLGVCAMGVYALTPAGATDALLSTAGNASCIAGGALWALASARATRAAWRMERRWLFAFGVLATGVLLVFLALFSTILHWAAALEAAGDFALETLGPPVGANATIGRWHGQVGSASLARVEAVVCGAYVSCCAPDAGGVNDILAFSAADVLAASGAQSACLSPFAGLRGAPVDAGAASSPSSSYASDTNLTAAQVAFIDPSARPFCEYVSGSPRAGSVTAGACDSLQTHVLGFDVGTCRADFCAAGVDGYAHFLATAFTAVRERAAWIGALLFLGGLCQVVQIASTFALVSATARLKFAARRGSAGPKR